MKRPIALLRLALLVAAIVASTLAVFLLAIERSGYLERRLRASLADAIGPLGDALTIESARLDWLSPALEVEGLELRDSSGGETLARVDRARVELALLEPEGARVESIDVLGGRVVLGGALLDAIASARSRLASPPAPREIGTLPRVRLAQIAVDWRGAGAPAVALGSVELVVDTDAGGALIARGRLAPAGSTSGALALELVETSPGAFQARAFASDLALEADGFAALLRAASLEGWTPSAKLSASAEARFELARIADARGSVRAELRDGSCASPDGRWRFEDLAVDVALRLEPPADARSSARQRWSGAVHLSGRRDRASIDAWGLLGSEANGAGSARGWMVAKDLDVAREDLASLRASRETLEAFDAVGCHPRGDLVVGVALGPEGRSVAVEFRTKGASELAFAGWAGPDGLRDGFPLPATSVEGRVIAVHASATPRRLEATHVAMVDVVGLADGVATAPATFEGAMRSRPDGVPAMELDLRLRAQGIAIDERLHQALRGADHLDWVWSHFAPRGGTGGGFARIQRLRGDRTPVVHLDLAIHEVGAQWRELPAPLQRAGGRIELLFDPRAMFVGFDLQAELADSDGVRVEARGRVQEDPSLPRIAGRSREVEGAPSRSIEELELTAANVPLKGGVRDALSVQIQGVGQALDSFGAVGRADVRVRASRHAPSQALVASFEIAPRQVQLSPQAFQVQTRNVRGRVIVRVDLPPHTDATKPPRAQVETSVQPLIGDWAGDTRVAFRAEFPARGAARLSLAGAGLNVNNRALAGAFRQAFSRDSAGAFDLGALSIDGRIDLNASIRLPEGAEKPESLFVVHLRDNGFQIGSGVAFGLEGLHGVLVQQGEVLLGDGLRARIGDTPILLKETRFYERDGVYHVEAEPEARDLPLDREHMRFFLDEETLDALERKLRWRGTVDIVDASLAFVGRSSTDGRVTFRGAIAPRDTFFDFGLPVSIDSVRVLIREFVLEGGSVRAWAELEDLSGRIADRNLERGQMLVTYVQPHLSILDLSGDLEGGRITDLGSGEARSGGPAFSIDLAEPFAFDLGLRVADVDVGELLRGLFESDFADTGKLSGDLRLYGNLDRLTGIHGRGSIDVVDSRLWSIPVVRDLLSQLGLDSNAIFKRVRSRFAVEDGVIDMKTIHIESPLMQLVGKGKLDFDGRLEHDLEVRYGLVDRLGPLTRVVYWIQNNLLRVSIRGDMQRPKVVLRGVLSFLQRSKGARRELPLPPFQPLPERF